MRLSQILSRTLVLPFNERIKKFVKKDWSLGGEYLKKTRVKLPVGPLNYFVHDCGSKFRYEVCGHIS